MKPTIEKTLEAYIAEHPRKTAWQISKAVRISSSSVSAILSRMRAKGTVDATPNPSPECAECGSRHKGLVYTTVVYKS